MEAIDAQIVVEAIDAQTIRPPSVILHSNGLASSHSRQQCCGADFVVVVVKKLFFAISDKTTFLPAPSVWKKIDRQTKTFCVGFTIQS